MTDLRTLVKELEAPLEAVTTAQVYDARDRSPRELWEMLLIDDAGIAEGVARGIWTVSA